MRECIGSCYNSVCCLCRAFSYVHSYDSSCIARSLYHSLPSSFSLRFDLESSSPPCVELHPMTEEAQVTLALMQENWGPTADPFVRYLRWYLDSSNPRAVYNKALQAARASAASEHRTAYDIFSLDGPAGAAAPDEDLSQLSRYRGLVWERLYSGWRQQAVRTDNRAENPDPRNNYEALDKRQTTNKKNQIAGNSVAGPERWQYNMKIVLRLLAAPPGELVVLRPAKWDDSQNELFALCKIVDRPSLHSFPVDKVKEVVVDGKKIRGLVNSVLIDGEIHRSELCYREIVPVGFLPVEICDGSKRSRLQAALVASRSKLQLPGRALSFAAHPGKLLGRPLKTIEPLRDHGSDLLIGEDDGAAQNGRLPEKHAVAVGTDWQDTRLLASSMLWAEGVIGQVITNNQTFKSAAQKWRQWNKFPDGHGDPRALFAIQQGTRETFFEATFCPPLSITVMPPHIVVL